MGQLKQSVFGQVLKDYLGPMYQLAEKQPCITTHASFQQITPNEIPQVAVKE